MRRFDPGYGWERVWAPILIFTVIALALKAWLF